MAEPLLVAQSKDVQCHLLPQLANRHGLITGATGLSYTVTATDLHEINAMYSVQMAVSRTWLRWAVVLAVLCGAARAS